MIGAQVGPLPDLVVRKMETRALCGTVGTVFIARLRAMAVVPGDTDCWSSEWSECF